MTSIESVTLEVPDPPAAKGFWGCGGVVQDPGGAIWKVATSSKKDTGPATREVDDFVLLLGVENVKATRQFYLDRGLAVAKSFGSKYVEFDTPSSPVRLALYNRRAAAKDAGVSPDGTGSHRIVIGSDAGPFHRPGRVRVGGRTALSRAAQHNITAITWDRRSSPPRRTMRAMPSTTRQEGNVQ